MPIRQARQAQDVKIKLFARLVDELNEQAHARKARLLMIVRAVEKEEDRAFVRLTEEADEIIGPNEVGDSHGGESLMNVGGRADFTGVLAAIRKIEFGLDRASALSEFRDALEDDE